MLQIALWLQKCHLIHTSPFDRFSCASSSSISRMITISLWVRGRRKRYTSANNISGSVQRVVTKIHAHLGAFQNSWPRSRTIPYAALRISRSFISFLFRLHRISCSYESRRCSSSQPGGVRELGLEWDDTLNHSIDKGRPQCSQASTQWHHIGKIVVCT